MKRKIVSEHEEPPHKRHKSNGPNEPPFIVFSPQQSSNEEGEDMDMDMDMDTERDMDYNPDIIQGLEYLIPSSRYNPFYDPSLLIDTNSTALLSLSSHSLSPALIQSHRNINSYKMGTTEGGGPPPPNAIELLSDDSDISDDSLNHNSKSEFMRYPLHSPKPVIITIGDIGRLRALTYLNDSIIDFYLKYLYTELLSEEQRNDTYIFTQFFYTKLESAIVSNNESARLKLAKWTKDTNIFEKKVLIIPINSCLHWSLAIVCNPGYRGIITETETESIYSFCQKQLFSVISHHICGEPKWVNEVQTNAKVLRCVAYPCKILHLDSMRGCHATKDIYTNLRIYLSDMTKTSMYKYTKDNCIGVSLGVPQQSNCTDCGVFVLHFSQLFAMNPFFDAGNAISRNLWFDPLDIARKRIEIKQICVNLRRKQGKPAMDIDLTLNKLNVTVQSQSGYQCYENDSFDSFDSFEDRLWETSEHTLKQYLSATARNDTQFHKKLKTMLDHIDSDVQ